MTPTDEEGKARPTEVMQELVQAAHQAHTRKALDNIKVSCRTLSRNTKTHVFQVS